MSTSEVAVSTGRNTVGNISCEVPHKCGFPFLGFTASAKPHAFFTFLGQGTKPHLLGPKQYDVTYIWLPEENGHCKGTFPWVYLPSVLLFSDHHSHVFWTNALLCLSPPPRTLKPAALRGSHLDHSVFWSVCSVWAS